LIRLPRPLAIDTVRIYYYKRKSKPYAESLEQWRVLAESRKGDLVLRSCMLSRLGKPIVSAVTTIELDRIFTSTGGDIALSLVSTKLGVVKDSFRMNGAGLIGMKTARSIDVSMTRMLFDLDMHMLGVVNIGEVFRLFCEWYEKRTLHFVLYAYSENVKYILCR
jgi:hypothetical protein